MEEYDATRLIVGARIKRKNPNVSFAHVARAIHQPQAALRDAYDYWGTEETYPEEEWEPLAPEEKL